MTLGVLALAMALILYGVADDILEMKREVAMPTSAVRETAKFDCGPAVHERQRRSVQ